VAAAAAAAAAATATATTVASRATSRVTARRRAPAAAAVAVAAAVAAAAAGTTAALSAATVAAVVATPAGSRCLRLRSGVSAQPASPLLLPVRLGRCSQQRALIPSWYLSRMSCRSSGYTCREQDDGRL
jgi:hypothetical protein